MALLAGHELEHSGLELKFLSNFELELTDRVVFRELKAVDMIEQMQFKFDPVRPWVLVGMCGVVRLVLVLEQFEDVLEKP